MINSWKNFRELTGGPFLTSLRAGNVIGGGDFASDRLMPDLVRGLISKEIVEIRNIGSTRPWQHVLDPLFGYLVAVAFSSKNASDESFNFGPDEPSYAVSKLLEIVALNFPNRIKVKILSEADPKVEAKCLDLDSTHAKKVLSWNPVWNQEQAVISTVDWWINCVDGNMNSVESSKQDIELLMRSYQIS